MCYSTLRMALLKITYITRQDGICCNSHGALAGTRYISMDPPNGIDPTTHFTLSGSCFLKIIIFKLEGKH